MSVRPAVSVVVVSRGRPQSLSICLAGLARLLYAPYEIVVVADPAGLRVVEKAGLAQKIKTVAFDEPNISAARNLGIAEAAGEIVAFIDDDAVPEPAWLTHLVQGFSWPEAAAAGGYVRGRNGISYQWRARSVDATGKSTPIELDTDRPVLLTPSDGRAIKTEGTNMAVRRDILAEMGGFDPAFRFYLDETDLNLRLARAGHATAIVPLAEVHHAYAPSARRARDRAPRDLYDIGASTAAFARRHAPDAEWARIFADLRKHQRRTLLRHMVAGGIEPRDVRRLMARLEKGIVEGGGRAPAPMPPIAHAVRGFLPFETRANGAGETIGGRLLFRRRHRARAQAAAAEGRTVSLFLFSRTARPHRVRFTPDGVWEQRGGLWGRSDRNQPAFRAVLFSTRLAEEEARVRLQRLGPAGRA